MPQIEDISNQLADAIEEIEQPGLIIHQIDPQVVNVFASNVDSQLAGLLARALDENPVMIGFFLDALEVVRRAGKNKDDAEFSRVIFGFERGRHN